MSLSTEEIEATLILWKNLIHFETLKKDLCGSYMDSLILAHFTFRSEHNNCNSGLSVNNKGQFICLFLFFFFVLLEGTMV